MSPREMAGAAFRRVWLSLRSLLLRRRLEREMHEEMAQHVERATARLIARGLAPEEAGRAALREFGNVGWLEERARDARGARWVEALAGDLRFALRQFARRPWTTLTMFVVLAGGMTLSTIVFAYVRSYAEQPPPAVERSADLVRIRGSQDDGASGRVSRGFSEEELLAYRALEGPFLAVAGWSNANVALDAGGDLERRGLLGNVTFVTEEYFRLLGVRPLLGPGLPEEGAVAPADAAVAVIGHRAWQQLFGADPDVLGRVLTLNGVAVTVVGVAPERFTGVPGFGDVQLWVPLAAREALLPPPPRGAVVDVNEAFAGGRVVFPPSGTSFRAAARLRPGVGADAATAAVQGVIDRFAAADPDLAERGPSTEVVPLLSANSDPMFDRDVRLMSFAGGLLALLVLAVTCTNVSGLLTGLATARRQEIAVRLSLGASRGRLVRQLLTESALLGSFAGAAALATVGLVLRTFTRLVPDIPLELGVTGEATSFTLLVGVGVGVVFGLSPALHATRLALAGALRDSAGGLAATRARLQRGLVVAQIALTQPLMVLLAAALLLVFGFLSPGPATLDAERIVRIDVRPPYAVAGGEAAEAARVELRGRMEGLVARLAATPGVEVAVHDWGPGPDLDGYRADPADAPGGSPQGIGELVTEQVAPGWLAVRGGRILRGRDFRPDDAGALARARNAGGGEVPAIVAADLAERAWGGLDPIGRRLVAGGDAAGPTLVVVGVYDDPSAEERRAGEAHRVLLPPDTHLLTTAAWVRTVAPAAPLLPELRRIVLDEAPGTIPTLTTVAAEEERARRGFRLASGGVSAAGAVALLLAALGLYAVVAFSVGQRTREIAVRMAVGASGRQIVRRYVADALRLGGIGVAIGLPISVLGLRLLMIDPDVPRVPLAAVTSMAVLGVLAVATAAAWIPARRAASVDVAGTLRRE